VNVNGFVFFLYKKYQAYKIPSSESKNQKSKVSSVKVSNFAAPAMDYDPQQLPSNQHISKKNYTAQYVRTTAGRVLFNQIVQECLEPYSITL
jgi:hypothetical protein